MIHLNQIIGEPYQDMCALGKTLKWDGEGDGVSWSDPLILVELFSLH